MLHCEGCEYVLTTKDGTLIISAKHGEETKAITTSLPKAVGAAELFIVAGSLDAKLGDKLAAQDKPALVRDAEWLIVRCE